MSDLVLALVSAALINHLVLLPEQPERARLHALGLCSALLMFVGLPVGYLLQYALLAPFGLEPLRLFVLLPLLAGLACGLPWLLTRLRPNWPVDGLQTVLLGNVAALGLWLELGQQGSSLLQALGWGLLAGPGFWLALLLFADLRERCQQADIPVALRGLPIDLIAGGVMAMAFSGLSGVIGL